MGKLILLIAVLALVAILVLAAATLIKRWNRQAETGDSNTKQRIKDLEAQNRRYKSGLNEIREIAESSQVTSGDPLWSFVMDKADAALAEKGIEK